MAVDPWRDDVEEFYEGVDRWFDSVVRAQRREVDAMFAEAKRMRQRSKGNMWIQKSEYLSDDGYSYYESVTVTTGDPWAAHTASSSLSLGAGVLTLFALLMSAAYALLTFRFNQNYGRSTFREDQRVKLSLLWPSLMISPEFREKFTKVLSAKSEEKKNNDDRLRRQEPRL